MLTAIAVVGMYVVLYLAAALMASLMVVQSYQQHAVGREAVIIIGNRATIFESKHPVLDVFLESMDSNKMTLHSVPDVEAYFPKAGEGSFVGAGLDAFVSHRQMHM